MQFVSFCHQLHPRLFNPLLGAVLTLVAVSQGFLATPGVAAAELRARLSTREAYVGDPFVLQVVVEDVDDVRQLSIPDVDGVSIRSLGVPARHSQQMYINGRVSSSMSLIYKYAVTAERPGEFEIPSIRLNVNGQNLSTDPLSFVATVSETGDLLFVEIEGKQDHVYVGQPLDLTLKIWVRPFRDRQFEVTLDEADMWSMISPRTSWGSFALKMQDLDEHRQRPGGTEVLRKDAEGTQRSYYLYEIEATIYPKRPGQIDASDVRVVMDYPVALERTRDPMESFFSNSPLSRMLNDDRFGSAFGPRLRITKTRPIDANASVDATQVLPIPTDGRPESYQGAVGNYEITARTNTRQVDAGDPITLQITIRGDGPLELVQAPRLDILNLDFRVDQQPLAGFVQDGAKYFTTTVRPRNTSVKEIPAIEMSFFDPESETFQTVASEAIPIVVSESETLGLDAIVSDAGVRNRASESNESQATASQSISPAAYLFRNQTSESVLAHDQPRSILRPALMLLLIPPCCFLGIWTVVNRSRLRSPKNWLGSRRHRAVTALKSVSTSNEIPAVLTSYLNSLRGVSGSSSDADWLEGLGFLRRNGQSQLAAELETLSHECRNSSRSFEALLRQSIDWVERTDAARKSWWRTVGTRRASLDPSGKRESVIRQSAIGMILMLFCSLSPVSAFASGEEVEVVAEDVQTASPTISLDASQRSALLAEAGEIYAEAFGSDGDESAEKFKIAAAKYQQIVDSGVSNGGLFLNLGNAYFNSGQVGRAIANYLRAQRYAPLSFRAQTNGLLAQVDAGVAVSQWRLPLLWIVVLGVGSVVGWALLIARIYSKRRSFGWLRGVMLMLAVLGFTMVLREIAWEGRDHAIAVVSELTLRSGDGESFEIVETVPAAEGRAFDVGRTRGEWIQVRIDESRQGWTRLDDVEFVR
ncbi:BatD family protein [Aporhodopirellula aestuarii]|uniref:BatD family protein n=1 Tax=Aporhodopirellula aestuarii TaxID=2950107 RepID=A0ABT0U6K4_9BACT|nr:BatD family protein [Aporhodopirellula aestuarii]MCM2372023.1 BatD family protein [Aporhodopirellula aestuarii]